MKTAFLLDLFVVPFCLTYTGQAQCSREKNFLLSIPLSYFLVHCGVVTLNCLIANLQQSTYIITNSPFNLPFFQYIVVNQWTTWSAVFVPVYKSLLLFSAIGNTSCWKGGKRVWLQWVSFKQGVSWYLFMVTLCCKYLLILWITSTTSNLPSFADEVLTAAFRAALLFA